MLVNTVFGIVGTVLMACSKFGRSYEMLIIGRFIIGFHCGEFIVFFFSNHPKLIKYKCWTCFSLYCFSLRVIHWAGPFVQCRGFTFQNQGSHWHHQPVGCHYWVAHSSGSRAEWSFGYWEMVATSPRYWQKFTQVSTTNISAFWI